MKILVLNCGSSSIKYALYNMDDKSVMTIFAVVLSACGGLEMGSNSSCENFSIKLWYKFH